ncbi:MAG: PIN domain-containing protein [Candidatus Omnitrophica bacterium]|nr:PIN domain-containing protein [Candidatus Omnitrophota bacterium]
MISRYFIDTNILVYSVDSHDKHKQKMSRMKLIELEKNRNGIISTQIIQEFYITSVKKLKTNPVIAKQQVERLSSFEVIEIDVPLIKEAIDLSIVNQFNFWDALVMCCALKSQCDFLLTEDLSHGQMIKNVKVENIFRTRDS